MSKVDVKRVVEHVRNNIRTGSPTVLSPAEAIALFGGGYRAGQSVQSTDFEEKVRAGYYRCELPYGKPGTPKRGAYRAKQTELNGEWNTDLRNWLLAMGVPEAYVDKVAAKAYDMGHSGGYDEIMCEAHELIKIFS